MSARAAVGRLAAMDREELRFRVTCEARKMAGRLRYAVSPPRWDRAVLVRTLDPQAGPLVALARDAAARQDYLAAHRALAEHFQTRDSVWPLQSPRRGALGTAIGDAFPSAAADARARATRVMEGRHDLLGYRNVLLGNPPDWHADRIHSRTAPAGHWAAVPYLAPASGDHKIIWETNRHQYFLALGRAYWLTGDRACRATFIAHLEDWLRVNPPLSGVNWASMLEVAFRALSWTWAVEFFTDGAEDDATPWLVDLLVSLDRQLTHVAHNLSTYFSPNTHLTGEALALYAVSTAFPELRRSGGRAAAGRDVLLREAHTQVRPDGGHVELSAHYHRYTTDFYLLALMIARASGDPAAAAFEQTARNLSAYLRTMADDRGRLPTIGDDDGGRLFRFNGGAADHADATLAVAASMLEDSSLSTGTVPEESWWTLGAAPLVPRSAVTPWPSRLLPDSGYLVSRSADGHLVFDAGPHGFLNGGHAHSDALAIVLTVGTDPLLIDPGTATYTMRAETRDRFRSSRMHNTLVLDGRDHAEPNGPFHWRTRADARFLVARVGPEMDFAVGTHDAYAPRRHIRAVVTLHGTGWLVVDQVQTSTATTAEAWWHLHPDWRAERRDGAVELEHGSGRRLTLASTAAELSIVRDDAMASYAPEYGRVEGSVALVARQSGDSNFLIGTFVPVASARPGRTRITAAGSPSPPRAGWSDAAFVVHHCGDDFEITVAFPDGPQAQPDDWPQPCIIRLPAMRII